jgi:hypothetical protein
MAGYPECRQIVIFSGSLQQPALPPGRLLKNATPFASQLVVTMFYTNPGTGFTIDSWTHL